jgi:hypothetical protein
LHPPVEANAFAVALPKGASRENLTPDRWVLLPQLPERKSVENGKGGSLNGETTPITQQQQQKCFVNCNCHDDPDSREPLTTALAVAFVVGYPCRFAVSHPASSVPNAFRF